LNPIRDALAHPIGVAIGDMLPPEEIPATARWLEELGFSHITVPEDCFYLPAQVGVTLALQATERIPVGTSIVSALTRHPAILAMELAGISRAFPDRFWPGIGLGLPVWLEQMGLMPERPVAAMREAVTSVQRLLAGEKVDLEGKEFRLDGIEITHPAREHVPLTVGVMSPMMLRLAGQIADATLFAASSGLRYFEHAIGEVQSGLAKAGRADDAMAYRTVAVACVDRDGERARSIARPVMAGFLAEFADMSTITVYGIGEELADMVRRGGADAVENEMPDSWLDDLALVGTPDEVVNKVNRWVAAGIDAIAIFLPHESERDTLALVAQEVIPSLSSAAGPAPERP
jgi:alkanesulfonate monooxygenase SsuD/methylene tetrahydromethanopterin reductase-like flavin-dependent oxidoreductase (luciferase family)